MVKQTVLMEFNELCPSLMDKWIEQGLLPNFGKLKAQSKAFVTEADAKPPALEPWIQWYSLHTGLAYEQHKVFSLTDGQLSKHDDIWQKLAASGKVTMNCSSMNAKPINAANAVYIPDPWCTHAEASPAELNTFYDFVSHHVQEYSNPNQAGGLKKNITFLKFMFKNGLKLSSCFKIAKLLIAGKLSSKPVAWKKAFVLDWLQTDLFLSLWKKHQPEFATFFLNSTAHLQHTYWKYMNGPKNNDYQDVVLAGYQNMDNIVGRFLNAFPHCDLILVTALSQQEYKGHDDNGGQHFYRPNDMASFLRKHGFNQDVQAVMTHQYVYRSENVAQGQSFSAFLSEFSFGDMPLFEINTREDGSVYFSCQVSTALNTDAMITHTRLGEIPFFDVFYQIQETKSGCHHPDGLFWWRTELALAKETRISLLDLYPTILDAFAVNQNTDDGLTRTGKSLLLHNT